LKECGAWVHIEQFEQNFVNKKAPQCEIELGVKLGSYPPKKLFPKGQDSEHIGISQKLKGWERPG
jgi:hypothetical protein